MLGGIDLTRTLAAGTVHWQQGLLEESHEGVVLLAMAERASRQVIAHLSNWRAMMGADGYVFPSSRTYTRPMSENAINAAFRRMGYSKEEITAHGLRATASTMLNESGMWSSDAIERALAHGDSNAIRGIYHRGEHWEERVRMAQWWSDHLDRLQAGNSGRHVQLSLAV